MNAGSSVPQCIHVSVACYYVDPQTIADWVIRAFRHSSALQVTVYTTNEKHRNAVSTTSVSDHRPTIHYIEDCFNDFTAYIAATNELTKRITRQTSDAIFIFLNDTLFLKHPAGTLLSLLRDCMPTVGCARLPILCGRTHGYRALIQTSAFAPGLDRYVSTFLFATNCSGLELLKELFGNPDGFTFATDASEGAKSKLPPKFVETLRLHLEVPDTVNSWKGKRSEITVRRKAVAVLLEQLVSARFYEDGLILPLAYDTAREWRLNVAYALMRAKSRLLFNRRRSAP